MLNVSNLNKSYGKDLIINDFNYEFKQGVYGLLGPNGAGKTTLINILAAASKADSGRVTYMGKDIFRQGEEYYDSLGYLPQEDCIYPKLSGRDYLLYFGLLKGMSKRAIHSRVQNLAKLCNLTDHLDKKCGKYSGGMKRRLGLMQALLNDPHVLILDEPTSGLDPIERLSLRNLISKFAMDRIVIYSTHIVSDIEQIANQIIFINSGRIVKEGSEEELLSAFYGKVWETIIDPKQFTSFASKYEVISLRQANGRIKLRYISESPLPNAHSVRPSLEDAFSSLFDIEARFR